MQRKTTGGFARGQLLLEGSGAASAGRALRILFQNENLLALEEEAAQHASALPHKPPQPPQQQQRLLAAVPDLICCVEAESEAAGCRFPAGSHAASLASCAVMLSQPVAAYAWHNACSAGCRYTPPCCRWAAHCNRGDALRPAGSGGGPARAPAADHSCGTGGGWARCVWIR